MSISSQILTIDDGMRRFSRDGQDRYVLDNIFHKKHAGFFLDVGASDGISENNTFLMERFYNWKGICCECDPRDIEKLSQNRSCFIVDSPIYKNSGELVDFEIHCANHLSGIAGYQLEKYRRSDSKVVRMSSINLMDCLKRFNAPTVIDYMSLDTEGTEYEILSSFDFNKYKINYIGVEHNSQEPKRTDIRNLLIANGYVFNRSVAQDDDYILKSFAVKNNIKVAGINE